jgi:hypothetical protein
MVGWYDAEEDTEQVTPHQAQQSGESAASKQIERAFDF